MDLWSFQLAQLKYFGWNFSRGNRRTEVLYSWTYSFWMRDPETSEQWRVSKLATQLFLYSKPLKISLLAASPRIDFLTYVKIEKKVLQIFKNRRCHGDLYALNVRSHTRRFFFLRVLNPIWSRLKELVKYGGYRGFQALRLSITSKVRFCGGNVSF